jgi:hypothetical protein
VRLVVNYSSGFSDDLWGWDVEVTHAESARAEIVWNTSCYEPEAKHEHRTRARTLPDWCAETLLAVRAIDFSVLPPRAQWHVYLDDAPTLSLRHERDAKSWVLRIFDLLEPIARRIHVP